MRQKTFLIGDLHLGHRKIADLRGFLSIEEHNDAIVELWNEVVSKKDTVWVLGDVCFGTPAFEWLKKLQGNKKLVLGNHDTYPIARYLEHFSKIYGAVELAGCILTHIPVNEQQFGRYKGNIHGHLHKHCLADPRYFNVSAEQSNLVPVPLESILCKLPIGETR